MGFSFIEFLYSFFNMSIVIDCDFKFEFMIRIEGFMMLFICSIIFNGCVFLFFVDGDMIVI